ncbi:hypothetical protein [Lancefieldella parvula]|uniref:hypothetical protein n=1 Tax=Lancefieldella parvula TaxID=1382 RepID=UPI0028802891|nr:hypothetical protein [Lancefieldella parvula]
MKFNKLGLVVVSASAVFALAGCSNLIPSLSDPGTTTGDQQQQQQQTKSDANTATKPSDSRAGDSDSKDLYNSLMDKYNTNEQITNVQSYVDDVKKTGDKTEVLIDTDKITVTVTGIGVDYENSNGYLIEVVNKTDSNIFIQAQNVTIGKNKLSMFVNAAPNTTTKGFAFFDPGVTLDPSTTLRGTVYALYGSDYSTDSFDVMF